MKQYLSYNSPIGKITIFSDGKAITALAFGATSGGEETPLIKEAYKQLDEYFNNKRKSFDIPLNPKGTDFQKKVWNALQNISYGKTKCYEDIAKEINNEKACRAIGNANNKNPLPIFIPCHRVIGKNGKLVGYAGGLDVKTKLLEIEKQ